MAEDKITLDRETFRILASDTRIEMLKLLTIRRMTLTEISKRLQVSPSTAKEHLDNLSGAGLVKQMDEGHKWKYYELTGKGRSIVDPVGKKVMLLLASAAAAAIVGTHRLIDEISVIGMGMPPKMLSAPLQETRSVMTANKNLSADTASAMVQDTSTQAPGFMQQFLNGPYPELSMAIIGILVTGICIGYIASKRRRDLVRI